MTVYDRHIAARVSASQGFSLVELMVAMVLGLLIVGGVLSIFITTSRSYATNQAVSEVQGNARVAFELLTQNIRQAGLTGCNSMDGRIANVLNNGPENHNTGAPPKDWWADWENVMRGYDGDQTGLAVTVGTAESQRVDGTDAMILMGATGTGLSVESSSNNNSAQFKLSAANPDWAKGDIIIVCDPDHATIMQITSYNSSNKTLVHNTGNSVSPGNCSKGLGFPADCSDVNGNAYAFAKNSTVSKLASNAWYIGNNPAGGRSLYKATVSAGSKSFQEIVRGVEDMQLEYHVKGAAAFDKAKDVTNWNAVDAVKVTLTLESSAQKAGTDNKPITRSFTMTTAIRNR